MNAKHCRLLERKRPGLTSWLNIVSNLCADLKVEQNEKVGHQLSSDNSDGETGDESCEYWNQLTSESILKSLSSYNETKRKIKNRDGIFVNIDGCLHFPIAEAMTPQEICSIEDSDIWCLSQRDKWRLYNFWRNQWLTGETEYLRLLLTEYEEEKTRLDEITKAIELSILKKATVVGLTSADVARMRTVMKNIQPRIVIVEEADEVLEAHIVASLTPGCEHLIMIGDHVQLRPKSNDYKLETKYRLGVSLFERMIVNNMHSVCLKNQHRMRLEIVDLLIPHFYKSLESDPSVFTYENVWGVLENLFFVSHAAEEEAVQESKDYTNHHEATFIAEFCKYLLRVGYKSHQITILTVHMGQVSLLRKLIPKDLSVRITTVDEYHGKENDIILISLVRSNSENKIGYLKTHKRIRALLSRAKKGLFIFGNAQLLRNESIVWKDVIEKLEASHQLVDSLPLSCHKHRNNICRVRCDEDFENVPHYGCDKHCAYQLDCGHVCRWKCHFIDQGHKNYKCEKPCFKNCEFQHPCSKKCFEKCGLCTTLVERTLTRCKHMVQMPCYMNEKDYKCEKPCSKLCQNNHSCSALCHEDCPPCKIVLERTLDTCQHVALMECRMKEYQFMCREPCQKCCERGHKCKQRCYEECRPCLELVEKELPKCHHRVQIPCWQDENDFICTETCGRLCSRGHPCIGKCGQECGDCEELVEQIVPILST